MAQDVLADKSLDANLIYIKFNFGFLPETIKCLEKSGVLLNDAITLIENTKISLQKCNGQKGKSVYEKFKKIQSKNDTLSKISKILIGENVYYIYILKR